MSDVEVKTGLGVVSGLLLWMSNQFNEILIILVILMIFDYILGVTAALKSGAWDPHEGIWGAIKKACYGILVACGYLADYIINFMSDKMHIPFQSPALFGLMVVVYLIGNEGLSLFRNLIFIGVPVPPFLLNVFGYFKDESGKLAKIPFKPLKTKRKGV